MKLYVGDVKDITSPAYIFADSDSKFLWAIPSIDMYFEQYPTFSVHLLCSLSS